MQSSSQIDVTTPRADASSDAACNDGTLRYEIWVQRHGNTEFDSAPHATGADRQLVRGVAQDVADSGQFAQVCVETWRKGATHFSQGVVIRQTAGAAAA